MGEVAHNNCRGCPIDRSAIISRQTDQADVAIVLDFPTGKEISRNKWFSGGRGSAAELVLNILDGLKIKQEDLYICSALNCRPNPEKKAMVKNSMLACRNRLIQELREVGVKKVLCMGSVGFSALMSQKKVLPITKIRGRWCKAFGMEVMATIPPGLVIMESGYFRDLIYDIEKFFNTDGRKPYPKVDAWIPDTTAEAMEAFDFLTEQDHISLDLETTGLSPIDDSILAAGFGTVNGTDGTSVIIDEALLEKNKIWRRIATLLNGKQALVFHNAKFDLKFLRRYLEEKGLPYKPTEIHDTLLLHYTLDERGGRGESQDGKSNTNKFKCHGLETLARTRYDAPDYNIDMRIFLKDWAQVGEYDRRQMRQKLHVYLTLDCYYTARLFPDLWNEALNENERLLDLYETLLIPGSLALTDVEYRGVLIDQQLYNDTAKKLERKAKRLLKRIREFAEDPEFNPRSASQVQKLVYGKLGVKEELKDEEGQEFFRPRGAAKLKRSEAGKKYDKESRGTTATPVLQALSHYYPQYARVLSDIMEYRNITKNLSTYIYGSINKLDSDGKLRGSFNLHGTETGRLSSSGPNLQNIPDTDHTGINVRAGFIAPEGYKLIEADYSQLEVRIAAELSGDPVMKDVFDSGRDVHSEISQLMYQLPPEKIDSYMRMLGKNILFGLLYGRGAKSVALGPEQEEVAKKRGVKWSVEEITEFFQNLLAEWKVYAEWQQDQKRRGYQEGFVQLPSGRRRRFPFIGYRDEGFVGRASFNTPIQGTASDFTLYAVIMLHEKLPPDAHVILTIHDSITVEAPESKAEAIADLMEHIMMNETFFKTKVPLKVKCKISDRWDWKQVDSRGTKAKRSVLK